LTLNNDGTFNYHNENVNAANDSFRYQACDNVTPPLCAPATVTIAIGSGSPSNHAPVAVDDAIQVPPNGSATVLVGGANSVLANDTDPDGDPITAALVNGSGPSHGMLTLNTDGTFNYQNNGDASAVDSFQYQACDNGAPNLCASATVTISIGGASQNHKPFAVDDAIDLPAAGMVATTVVGGAQSVLANDIDPDAGDALHADLLTSPAHGTLMLAGDGTFTYTNANDGAPVDSFKYQACDNHGACDMGVVTITIGGGQVNHLPVVVDDAIQTTPGGTTSTLIGGAASLLGNDSDPDPGETATLTALKMSGLLNSSGSVTLGSDGTFTYQDVDPSSTTDTFLYEACDIHGACTPGIVYVTITNDPLDQMPVATDDAIVVAPHGTSNTLVGGATRVLANDTDPDPGETAMLTAHLISAPENGHVTLNPDGTFAYVNDDPAQGVDGFQYEACDPEGACDAATVSVTVNGEAPTVSCVLPRQVDVVGDTVNLDLSLLFTPPPGQSLTYSGTNLPPSLSIVGSLLTGTLQASDVPPSPPYAYASSLTATTVPGGVSANENVIFQVLPAGEILLRNGFDGPTQSQPCQ
jgi:VCBS repeat-containing protein